MPLDQALKALRAREAELARVQRIGQIGGLEVDLRGGRFRNLRSPEYLLVHGLPPESADEPHEAWVARIHPDDRERVLAHFTDAVAGDTCDYEVEYRIVRPSDGRTRWIMAKAEIERDADGNALRLVGAHIDITARRTAEEQRALVSRELSHRIANIFSVMSSIIAMSARSEPSAARFAEDLNGRVGALHRAHNLIVHQEGAATAGDTLMTLLKRVMAPYVVMATPNVNIVGDDIEIGRGASTAVALLIHELATNAVKYGALSSALGTVTIAVGADGDHTTLTWSERGGPQIDRPPERKGFGSALIERTVRSQLSAKLELQWPRAGLQMSVRVPNDRLAN